MEQKMILIIDGEPNMVATVEAILKGKPYSVVTTSDRTEDLRKVAEEKPDLIILDVIRTGKHEFQVCKELRPTLSMNLSREFLY